MPDDLDDLIRSAADDLAPHDAVTARARDRVTGLTPGRRRGVAARVFSSRRGRAGTLALALVLVGGGAAASVSVLTERGNGRPYLPAPQNCFALNGDTLRIPRILDAVHLDEGGRATAVWITGAGVVVSATRDRGSAWGTPVPLSGAGAVASVEPALAGNARGDVVVAWIRDERVEMAIRPAGGSWGPARILSRDRQVVIAQPGTVPLAVGPAGEIVAAWGSVGESHVTRLGGGGYAISGASHIEVAVGTVADGMGAARVLRRTMRDGFEAQSLAVAVDGRGVPVLATGLGQTMVVDLDPATGAPVAGSLSRLVQPASPAGVGPLPATYSTPTLAVGPDGDTVVAWSAGGIVTVAVRPPGGRWGRPIGVSAPGADSGDTRISAGAGGRAAATWIAVTKTPTPTRPGLRAKTAWVSARSPGGVWGPPVRLSHPPEVVSAPDVVIDATGRVTAVWARGTNGVSGRDSRVGTADRPAAGGAWSGVTGLSSAGVGPLFPRIAVNATGESVAVWSRCVTRDTARVESATRAAGGTTWSPATILAAP